MDELTGRERIEELKNDAFNAVLKWADMRSIGRMSPGDLLDNPAIAAYFEGKKPQNREQQEHLIALYLVDQEIPAHSLEESEMQSRTTPYPEMARDILEIISPQKPTLDLSEYVARPKVRSCPYCSECSHSGDDGICTHE